MGKISRDKFKEICERELKWHNRWDKIEEAVGASLFESEIYDLHGMMFDDLCEMFIPKEKIDTFNEFIYGLPYDDKLKVVLINEHYGDEHPLNLYNEDGSIYKSINSLDTLYDYIYDNE